MEPITGYCVRCKEKRDMKDPQEVQMNARGGKTRPALKGTCVVCGTGMFKIMSSAPKA